MRILYKTLASIGMLALSTAAAIGIRRFVKRNDAHKDDAPSNTDDHQTPSHTEDTQNEIRETNASQESSTPEENDENLSAASSDEQDSQNQDSQNNDAPTQSVKDSEESPNAPVFSQENAAEASSVAADEKRTHD